MIYSQKIFTRAELEAHIKMLREWGESFGDVGDYRRQILSVAESYQDDLNAGRYREDV
jgi:hypothetical protein